MKMKTKTKKIIVLSVMVALLVATGVLNFVLSDKLNKTSTDVAGQQDTVTQTFFAAARSDRDATRELEFLYLDAIIEFRGEFGKSKDNGARAKNVARRENGKRTCA